MVLSQKLKICIYSCEGVVPFGKGLITLIVCTTLNVKLIDCTTQNKHFFYLLMINFYLLVMINKIFLKRKYFSLSTNNILDISVVVYKEQTKVYIGSVILVNALLPIILSRLRHQIAHPALSMCAYIPLGYYCSFCCPIVVNMRSRIFLFASLMNSCFAKGDQYTE